MKDLVGFKKMMMTPFFGVAPIVAVSMSSKRESVVLGGLSSAS